MKKQARQSNQKSSLLDLSKYKFIPPSKLLQVKAKQQQGKSYQFVSVIQQHHHQQQQQNISFKINVNKGEHSQSSKKTPPKQHQPQISKSKQSKLFRSTSNPKLSTSSSRTVIPIQKNMKIENKKQQQHLEKLTLFIAQLQSKDQIRNGEILTLREEKKLLNDKLDKLHISLALKTKQIADLTTKLTTIQLSHKQKYQQQILIIDSLKKVISSQLSKINQLSTPKPPPPTNKTKYKSPPCGDITLEFDDSQPILQQSEIKQEIMHRISARSDTKSISSLLYDQQIQIKKNSMQYISKDDSRDDNFFQTLQSSNNTQPQSIPIDCTQIQYPTPIFGARTPKQQYLYPKVTQSDNNTNNIKQFQSLNCSLDQTHNNLQLSRISQTIQSDYSSTSQENTNRKQIIQQKNLSSRTQISTHQQLLDQIDQYLSKRVYSGNKK